MSELWATPQALFDKLDKEFGFSVDVCATDDNAKCQTYLTKEMDALTYDWTYWGSTVWMNPPYGRGIDKWMKKAWETARLGVRLVALIPGRTNAPWWHQYVMVAEEIRFIKHKVAFDVPNPEQDKGVPFWGSAIVVYEPEASYAAPVISTYMQPKHEATR